MNVTKHIRNTLQTLVDDKANYYNMTETQRLGIEAAIGMADSELTRQAKAAEKVAGECTACHEQ